MNLFGFNKLSFYFIDLLFQYLLSYLSYSIFLLLKFIKLSCFHIILLFLLILDTLNFIFPISLYLPPFLLFLNVFCLFILNISQFLKLKLCYYVLLLKIYHNNLNNIDINHQKLKVDFKDCLFHKYFLCFILHIFLSSVIVHRSYFKILLFVSTTIFHFILIILIIMIFHLKLIVIFLILNPFLIFIDPILLFSLVYSYFHLQYLIIIYFPQLIH